MPAWVRRTLKRYSLDLHVHSALALLLNVMCCLTASPFNMLPKWMFVIYGLIALAAFIAHSSGKWPQKTY